VDAAYDADVWAGFAGAVVSAAAALAGLLFVSISINIRHILAGRGISGRAAHALILLTTPLVLSLAVLVPGQSDTALGVELLVIAAVVGTGLGWLSRPSRRTAEQPLFSWIISTALPTVALTASPLLAGVGLMTVSLGGLFWYPAAVVLGLLGGLLNAWVLLVEILR
jgi:hypothetical protein